MTRGTVQDGRNNDAGRPAGARQGNSRVPRRNERCVEARESPSHGLRSRRTRTRAARRRHRRGLARRLRADRRFDGRVAGVTGRAATQVASHYSACEYFLAMIAQELRMRPKF